jgi:hypothetical protein
MSRSGNPCYLRSEAVSGLESSIGIYSHLPAKETRMSLDTLVIPGKADLAADFEVDAERTFSSTYHTSTPNVPDGELNGF